MVRSEGAVGDCQEACVIPSKLIAFYDVINFQSDLNLMYFI